MLVFAMFQRMEAIICILCLILGANGFMSDRVLLTDTKVITLYHGKSTNSARAHPIPQLRCTGGSAGCTAFVPQVVQCYNKGTDGHDVQWECKTDMDNAYRFGMLEVSCEGYDYPEDPYILKGSCGLEYTLDLTAEGQQKKHQQGHNYYGGDSSYQHTAYTPLKTGSSGFGDLVLLAIVGLVIYAIYKSCLGTTANSRTYDENQDQPSQGRYNPYGSAGSSGGYRPPPAGFRQEYTSDAGCRSSNGGGGYGSGMGMGGLGAGTSGGGGGGFWTGAATGGLLGYMFGSRNNHYGGGYHQPGFNSWGTQRTGWGGGLGSSWASGTMGSRSGWGSTGGLTGSTGTRTASGFATTKRR